MKQLSKKKALITGGIFIPASALISLLGVVVNKYVHIEKAITEQKVRMDHIERLIDKLDNRQYDHTRKHISNFYIAEKEL